MLLPLFEIDHIAGFYKTKILMRVYDLMSAYNQGLLGGEKIPEHDNPALDR